MSLTKKTLFSKKQMLTTKRIYEEVTVDFERLTYNGEYIYVYKGEVCKYNEKENLYEKTGKKWDYKTETIYTENK